MELDLSAVNDSDCKIINEVLQRDKAIRAVEEQRIRQLKLELQRLRKKGALRQGLDPARSCARCMSELGRIINRGALCPVCRKKVCKSCRQYGDDGKYWLCIVCQKQKQVKAAAGEWMQDYSRLSIRRRGRPPAPGDLVRNALQEQRKTSFVCLKEASHPESNKENLSVPLPTSSRKPERTVPCQLLSTAHSDSEVQEASGVQENNSETKVFLNSEDFVTNVESQMERIVVRKITRLGDSSSSSSSSSSPRINTRGALAPNGVGSECPTPPSRSPLSTPKALTRSVIQMDHSKVPDGDRQSSDEGKSILSFRSRSTSSEVTEESNYVPMPSPRKRISPLRKQNAVVVDTNDTRYSSLDTNDSGVYSPGPKLDLLATNNVPDSERMDFPVSPRTRPTNYSRRSSDSSGSHRKLVSGSLDLPSESVCSLSETEVEKASGVVFRKVTLKKHKTEGYNMENRAYSDESGISYRSSPRGRLHGKGKTSSAGSDDIKQGLGTVPQISVLDCTENPSGRGSVASSDKDSSGVQDDELDHVFTYPSRSHISLSSFGARSESMTSVYSAAGGGRYGTVTVSGEVLFGLNYNYKGGSMEVHIKECRNLAPVDTKHNRSDPYVKVYLLPDRTKSGKRKTKVKKHTLNPVFDELLKFQVTISELETRTMWLSVWHSDMFGRNDFLGEVMLPLGYDVFEDSSLKWYPLQERLESPESPLSYKGDLILALKYVPPDVTSRKRSKKPGEPAKGSLHVLVKEARNLMATRSNGTSDPFCKSYLLPDKSKSGKQKTPVLKKICNPKWNHTFVYDNVTLEELRERCLELTIWDYDKITSNDFLGGVRLSTGTGKCQGRDADWMDSVGEEASLWHSMLDRPNMWVDGSLLLRPNMQSHRS